MRTLAGLALLVLLVGAADAAPIRFSSVSTPIYDKCKKVQDTGGDDPLRCPGKGGYRVEVHFAAATSDVVVTRKGGFSLSVSVEGVPAQMAWRRAGKTPFAVIVSQAAHAPSAEGDDPIEARFFVRGLAGFETIDRDFSAKDGPDPQALARAYADAEYAHILADPPHLDPCGAPTAPQLTSYVGLMPPVTVWVDLEYRDGGWYPATPIAAPEQRQSSLELQNVRAFPVIAAFRTKRVRATVTIEKANPTPRKGSRAVFVASLKSICLP